MNDDASQVDGGDADAQERAALFPPEKRPFFDASRIDGTKNQNVAWVDLMGAKSAMGRSLFQTANFIGKIHTAAFTAAHDREGARVYPVIDGCYITAGQQEIFESVLRTTMLSLANAFVSEEKMSQRFLVRGGIAAGRIIPGAELAKGSNTLQQRAGYKGAVALGTAIGQAYMAEAKAPPFGYFVDITARSFAAGKKQPFTSVYWRWWDDGREKDVRRREIILSELKAYYRWVASNHRGLEYPVAAYEEHRERAFEYFRGGWSDETATNKAEN